MIPAFHIDFAPTFEITGKKGLFPSLVSEVAGQINWNWIMANPSRWLIKQSVDGITWTTFGLVVGVARTAGGLTSGNFYEVTGLDGGGIPITQTSNFVRCL